MVIKAPPGRSHLWLVWEREVGRRFGPLLSIVRSNCETRWRAQHAPASRHQNRRQRYPPRWWVVDWNRNGNTTRTESETDSIVFDSPAPNYLAYDLKAFNHPFQKSVLLSRNAIFVNITECAQHTNRYGRAPYWIGQHVCEYMCAT